MVFVWRSIGGYWSGGSSHKIPHSGETKRRQFASQKEEEEEERGRKRNG